MLLQHGFSKLLIGSTAFLFGTAGFNANGHSAPAAVQTQPVTQANALGASGSAAPATGAVGTRAKLNARRLFVGRAQAQRSARPQDAFNSYFAFKAAHPNDVKEAIPLLRRLRSAEHRGAWLRIRHGGAKVVDGPFTVAHGRGSAPSERRFRRDSRMRLEARRPR
jgi:hypothetical protein